MAMQLHDCACCLEVVQVQKTNCRRQVLELQIIASDCNDNWNFKEHSNIDTGNATALSSLSAMTSYVSGPQHTQHNASNARLIDALKCLTADLQYGRSSYSSRG